MRSSRFKRWIFEKRRVLRAKSAGQQRILLGVNLNGLDRVRRPGFLFLQQRGRLNRGRFDFFCLFGSISLKQVHPASGEASQLQPIPCQFGVPGAGRKKYSPPAGDTIAHPHIALTSQGQTVNLQTMRKLLILSLLLFPIALRAETPKLPKDKELKALVFDSLFAFNKGVQEKSFAQFHSDRLSPLFQKQFPLDKFTALFRRLSTKVTISRTSRSPNRFSMSHQQLTATAFWC